MRVKEDDLCMFCMCERARAGWEERKKNGEADVSWLCCLEKEKKGGHCRLNAGVIGKPAVFPYLLVLLRIEEAEDVWTAQLDSSGEVSFPLCTQVDT